MDDSQIIALYWARDEEAIRHTEEKYQAYLSRIACNILHDTDDALECVNDTYLKAWNSIPPHRPSVLSTYLGKITREGAIDRVRRRTSAKRQASQYARSLSELDDCFPGPDTPDQHLDAQLLDEAITAFLRTLPDDARTAFIGRYYFFDPLKDVAAYCGMSQAKAKSLLFRTRKRLKAYLIQEGFDL